MSVNTAYELATLLRLDGAGVFAATPRPFDELEQASAVVAYHAAVARARQIIGVPYTLTTHGGAEVTAGLREVVVELWQYKRGEDWCGNRTLVGARPQERIDGMRTIVTAPRGGDGSPPDPTPRPGVSSAPAEELS